MSERGWQREFEDPITLPGGGMIVTLEDAARYIQKLPKKEQALPHWQTALTLINTAEGRDFLFHANAVMLQALHHGKAAPATAPRRKAAKAFKIVK